jgi:hypothetical protein
MLGVFFNQRARLAIGIVGRTIIDHNEFPPAPKFIESSSRLFNAGNYPI